MTKQPMQAEEEHYVKLENPALAAFLAWLVPGLGHLYQRRTAKAILFFVCIMSTFGYGLYLGSHEDLGGGRVVYASWPPGHWRLQYLCQVGVGLPALPALVEAHRAGSGKPPLFGGFMAPPRPEPGEASEEMRDALAEQPTLNTLHRKMPRPFEYGTTYTMIAGLLNILAIYDAWGGPVFSEKGKEEEEEGSGEDTDRDKAPSGEKS